MRVTVARSITYGVVGVLAAAAVRLTPPLPSPGVLPGGAVSGFGSLAVREPTLRPFDLAAGSPSLAPVLVIATTSPRVDTIAIAGLITSSLSASLEHLQAGSLPKAARLQLAWTLADIFEYRVDMSRDLQKGDQFSALVERVQQPDGRVSVARVIAAHMAVAGQQIEAIHFSSRYAGGEYFDAEGKSLRAGFLRAPLSFRRISSGFGMRRHPILGQWRRHTGMDYAASAGTPVRSVGDGVIIFAGRRGGYGNVIDVRHRNGYITRYGHMRNFASGIRSGRRVKIGETIGYVGMTGLATAPHLHFEVLVGGVHRDPRVALNGKSGEPIARSEYEGFQNARARTLAALRSSWETASGD